MTVEVEKVKESLTKISPVLVKTKLESLDLNWKPDALLKLIKSMKEFMDIRPMAKNKDKSRQDILNNIQNDVNLIGKKNKYAKDGQNHSIKNKREEYLRINSKDDAIYIKLGMVIDHLKVNFIHRQTHMPMFLLTCENLNTSITFGKSQKYIEGHLKTLNLYEIFGYPQKKYEINGKYDPFCLVQKK